MDFNLLKTAIRNIIKPNGNEEITGQVMQNALVTMLETIAKGRTFVGIAYVNTNPENFDSNVFYIATQNGVYTKFNGIALVNEVALLINTATGWQKVTTEIANKNEIEPISGRLATAETNITNVENETTAIRAGIQSYECDTIGSEHVKVVNTTYTGGYIFGLRFLVRFTETNTSTDRIGLTAFGISLPLHIDGKPANTQYNNIIAGEVLEVWMTSDDRQSRWNARRMTKAVTNQGLIGQVLSTKLYDSLPQWEYPMQNSGFTRTLNNLVRMLNYLHPETAIETYWEEGTKSWAFNY